MYWAWPLLMIFIPTWIGNYVLPGEPAQRLWDPSEILLAWAPSILQLFAYSPGYCIGVGLVLGVCLYWWFRYSGLFYGALLFVASCMAGPGMLRVRAIFVSMACLGFLLSLRQPLRIARMAGEAVGKDRDSGGEQE